MFEMNLVRTGATPDVLVPCQYDPENDCAISIIHDLCGHFHRHQSAKFVVSGFGTERWNVDVATDLSVVVEQIPQVIRSLERGLACRIGFYKQGTERVIHCAPSGASVAIICKDLMGKPSPSTEPPVPIKAFLAMLNRVLETFMALAREASPQLASHPWITEWLRGERKAHEIGDDG